MNYKVALFDLDGTLTDPKIGICKGVQYSLKHFGIEKNDIDEFEYFIGPPLQDSFLDYIGSDRVEEAIAKFREYYNDIGIFENTPYDGVEDLLKNLKNRGVKLGIATSKPEVMALRVLEKFNLKGYFDFIKGGDLKGKKVHKEYIIEKNLEFFDDYKKEEIIMIGDRKFDINGAKNFGLDSIGVTFGYAQEGEFEEFKPSYIVNKTSEIEEIILKKVFNY